MSSAVGRVDHPNDVAVGDQALVLFIDANGALERAVYRVAAQERSPP